MVLMEKSCKKNKQKQYKTKQKQLAEVLELVQNVFTLLTSWTKPSTGLGVEATELTTIQFWSFVKRFHGLLCWNLLLIISLPCTRNKKIRKRCLPWRSGLNSADISAAGINSHPAWNSCFWIKVEFASSLFYELARSRFTSPGLCLNRLIVLWDILTCVSVNRNTPFVSPSAVFLRIAFKSSRHSVEVYPLPISTWRTH